jgi:hypothetical protein
MPTSDALTRLLAAAHAQVRSFDWASWPVPAGDSRLAEYVFADEPPLTNGLLQSYFSTCAWIWQRPITLDEQQRVAGALVVLWTNHGVAQDYAPLLDVLSVVAISDQLLTMPAETHEPMRQEFLGLVPDGRFPGVDVTVPGADAAAAVDQAKVPVSTLAMPDVTGVALDGLYSATTFGLTFDITGPPGSGTWGSTTIFYAFFSDGAYLYFPSANEVGAHIQDPVGHKAWHGQYEVNDGQIQLYDASDGTTNASEFTSTPDGKEIAFYGKQFTRIADTDNLRAAPTG